MIEQLNIKKLNECGKIGETPAYQRKMKKKKVDSIASGLDEILWGLPVLSLRDDGKYYAVDGQHRIEAASNIDRDLPVRVIRTSGSRHKCEKKEARIFVAINSGCTSLNSIHKFNALHVSGDEKCVAIYNEAASRGIVVTEHTQDNTISCVGQLYAAYDEGCLRRLIDCLAIILKKRKDLYKEVRRIRPTWVIRSLIRDGFFGKKADTGEVLAKKILEAFRIDPNKTLDLLKNATRPEDNVAKSQDHINLVYEFLKNPKGE